MTIICKHIAGTCTPSMIIQQLTSSFTRNNTTKWQWARQGPNSQPPAPVPNCASYNEERDKQDVHLRCQPIQALLASPSWQSLQPRHRRLQPQLSGHHASIA